MTIDEKVNITCMYFDKFVPMKKISEFYPHIKYRTIQKFIQRHFLYPRFEFSLDKAVPKEFYPILKDKEVKPIVEYKFPYEPKNTIYEPKPKKILVVGDLHAPFTLKGYLHFIEDIFEYWECTDLIQIGDLVDNHVISRHQTETSADSGEREKELTLIELHRWYKSFRKARVTKGNHDDIPKRQLATLGIPPSFLQTFEKNWEFPEEWEIADHYIDDGVLYQHGLGAGGESGAINKALYERMSNVQGHQHSVFGVSYKANQKDIIFGMSVGCGVDNNAYAFNYGKYAIKKPVIGCGVVISSAEAYAIPMPEKYFNFK